MSDGENKELTIWSGQLIQIAIGSIAILLFGLSGSPDIPEQQSPNQIFNLSVDFWYWAAILLPIFHQVTIGPLWRMELLDKRLTMFFGSTKSAFLFFKILFSLFFFPRLLIVIPLSILTRGSIESDLFSVGALFVAVILTPIIIYGFYSVKVYFGMNRAFGADHFFESYRSLPMVKEGIFKYSNNAMYTFVLAAVWVPALFLGSLPGLIVGLFNHLFVWIHYYATEKPDMIYLYT